MSNTQSTRRAPLSTTPSHILALASMGPKLGVILVIAGLAFLAVPAVAWFRTKTLLDPWVFWGVFLASWSLLNGAFYLANLSSMRIAEAVRLLIVAYGGGLGIATICLGLSLPFLQFSEIFAGGVPEWRKHPQPVFLCVIILLLGMGISFASILGARGSERESVTMRRILYGANTVITGLLLLAILGLVNVLSFVNLGRLDFFNTTFDYTQSNLYTLSSGTRELLLSLEEPVLVYMVIPEHELIGVETKTLLENCKAVAPKGMFSWVSLSRDRNRSELEKLREKFQANDLGLLVVYGAEGGKQQHEFTPYEKLFSVPPQRGMGQPDDSQTAFSFLGEEVLRKSLITLKEGKTDAKIYFTSGNGEMTEKTAGGISADSTSLLIGKLQKANYQVESLPFDIKLKQIPADAEIVVIARPQTDPPQEAINALREYLTKEVGGKKGKAVFLIDPERIKIDGKSAWTPFPNLKGLLAEFQVQVSDNQLVSLNSRVATRTSAVPNPESTNKVPLSFLESGRLLTFDMDGIRTVGPLPSPPGVPPGKYKVEEILLALRQLFVFEEKDASVDLNQLATEVRASREKQVAKLTKPMFTVGVLVTEGGSGLESIPGHERMTGDSKPRLAVFGDSYLISNAALAGNYGDNNYDLFYSTLSWLKERPDIGEKPKGSERKTYRLPMTEESPAFAQIKWTPLWLMMATVVVMGGAVWVVRRR